MKDVRYVYHIVYVLRIGIDEFFMVAERTKKGPGIYYMLAQS